MVGGILWSDNQPRKILSRLSGPFFLSRERGHDIPDIEILQELKRINSIIEVQSVSYADGAERLKAARTITCTSTTRAPRPLDIAGPRPGDRIEGRNGKRRVDFRPYALPPSFPKVATLARGAQTRSGVSVTRISTPPGDRPWSLAAQVDSTPRAP